MPPPSCEPQRPDDATVYLGRFESFAREARFAGKIAIMRSNGGTMSIGQARR